MLISFALMAILSVGGGALTYLFVREASILWRLAAGSIIGSAIFGIAAFIVACITGLTGVGVAVALIVALLPLFVFLNRQERTQMKREFAHARGKLEGGGLARAGGLAFYVIFFVIFWLFFGQTMYETDQGIFTGGSQNLGDLPFHLGAIYSFTDGANFPPLNPSFAGAKFSYPFIADLVTACFVRLGAGVRDAMVVQNFVWASALLVLVEAFARRLLSDRAMGRVAAAMLFLSGGLGFVWFFSDHWNQGKGIFDFLWSLPRDYTIGDNFRWGNSLVVLFITQRSLLLGMPLTVLVLDHLWSVFSGDDDLRVKQSSLIRSCIVGLLAGLLPLVHLHSLAALFVVTAALFVIRPALWRNWSAFGVGVCITAMPALIWSATGSASESSRFIDLHFGWDRRDANVFWFWLKNTGILIPAVAGAIYLYFRSENNKRSRDLLLFYVPFALIFLLCNVAKFAPWEWDNIKLLIYWYLGSVPLVAYLAVRIWRYSTAARAVSAIFVLTLIAAGSLDVWRTLSGQNRIKVFDADAVRVAEKVRSSIPADAVFLNAPTYNSASVLTGRLSFIRYTGHLASHGIDFAARESDVRTIYAGGGVAELLLKKNNISYVVVSPEERASGFVVNEAFFSRFPIEAESGQYRIYRVK
ncbi:MAG: hypothetical protein KF736_00945 [Acidobacteria bacterium]|nr:hypothetical protein [Acidobacteriota bacterium]MCW5948042.1 hypothetical protein [Pyrinomonadaceae bacterium]